MPDLDTVMRTPGAIFKDLRMRNGTTLLLLFASLYPTPEHSPPPGSSLRLSLGLYPYISLFWLLRPVLWLLWDLGRLPGSL